MEGKVPECEVGSSVNELGGVALSSKRDQTFEWVQNCRSESEDFLMNLRHQRSRHVSTYQVTPHSNGSWGIPSGSSSDVYELTRRMSGESCHRMGDCSNYCDHCSTCLHKFDCDCPDYRIHNNMCKHIHLLCRFLEEESNQSEEGVNSVQNS